MPRDTPISACVQCGPTDPRRADDTHVVGTTGCRHDRTSGRSGRGTSVGTRHVGRDAARRSGRGTSVGTRHAARGTRHAARGTRHEQTADSRQQTADSRQQTADSRQHGNKPTPHRQPGFRAAARPSPPQQRPASAPLLGKRTPTRRTTHRTSPQKRCRSCALARTAGAIADDKSPRTVRATAPGASHLRPHGRRGSLQTEREPRSTTYGTSHRSPTSAPLLGKRTPTCRTTHRTSPQKGCRNCALARTASVNRARHRSRHPHPF